MCKRLIKLFEEQVDKSPNATALIFKDEKITYEELDRRANGIAQEIINNIVSGSIKNELIPIISDPCIEMFVGIFGILKAGYGYVPIDPDIPNKRLNYILNDCDSQLVVLGKVNNSSPFINLNNHYIITVSDHVHGLSNRANVQDIGDTMYCIYTSGTTGVPKGVILHHRGIINRIDWMQETFPITTSDVILQKTNFMFDVSVWEIFWWCLHGAKCVIVPKELRKLPNEIYKICQLQKVTVVHFVPTALNCLNSDINKVTKKYNLKYCFMSGEELSKKSIQYFYRLFNGKLINLYGPTEASIDVTYYCVSPHLSVRPPIGKPIKNITIYIVDDFGNQCGVNQVGEIWIGGLGVAQGYLNQPDLTAQKFISNPFGEGRLFRTGDLGRWLPDGNIDYLGRIDNQIKIRGFRIELGEIDAALRELPLIKDCAVIAKESNFGDKEIYAYYISETKLDYRKVKDQLKHLLPDYMVPNYLKQIGRIPITSNGKLDKQKLPNIILEDLSEYKPLTTEIEKKVASFFGIILSVEPHYLGKNSDFFDMGGHSLKLVKLLNLIENEFKVRMEVKEIFANSTIQNIAFLITKSKSHYEEPVQKVDEKSYYPASSSQQRIFFVNQLQPEELLYNLPLAYKIEGELNLSILKLAFQKLINRHESLRTVFEEQGGKLRQIVLPFLDFKLEELYQRNQSIEDVVTSFVRPFDLLTQEPLFRVGILQVDSQSYVLLFDIHHIIADGTSLDILLKELSSYYHNEILPDPSIQYKDYSAWLSNLELTKHYNYWKERLKDFPDALDIPTDFHRKQIQSHAGSVVYESISPQLSSKISNFMVENRVTGYMFFLSILMIELGKYSLQDDIILGTPVSNRIKSESENMVGMLVNTLVVRGQPSQRKQYLEFLKEVKLNCLNDFEHGLLPFEELVNLLKVDRNSSRNPLFDIMFTYTNKEQESLILQGAEVEQIQIDKKVSQFDLTFNVLESNGIYSVALDYCSDLYSKQSASALLRHFLQIIKNVLEQPNQNIKDISMLSEEEEIKILNDFNTPVSKFQTNKTLVDLFNEQVEKHPDNIAVIFNDQEITYEELDKLSSRVSSRLIELGLDLEDFVGIVSERSIEMIVAIIGVMKAGGAYIPIDPEYPDERIQYILDDSKPKVLLTYHTKINTDIPQLNLAELQNWSIMNVDVQLHPNNLAYCIYTSGTTGTPKGVLIEHEGGAYLQRHLYLNGLATSLTRTIQFSSPSFDAIVSELCLSIFSGGIIYLLPESIRSDSYRLSKFLTDNKVNVAILPPNLLQTMRSISINNIILAGSEPSVELFSHLSSSNRCYNDYGPTEITVCATSWKSNNKIRRAKVPIGRPIIGKKLYILNNNELCGIGVPGELCIAGVGLARGYLNKPELTREKFVANPYGQGRLYRTGDLARWLPDGNVEYLGRLDDQVKVRGFRIELGEVEATLRKIEDIRDCAVIIRYDQSEQTNMLLAYLVSDQQLDYNQIYMYLENTLPQYMIPSLMMQIQEIPINHNGKLDKKSLPDIIVQNSEDIVEENLTLKEKVLKKAFIEILGCQQIGKKSNFFMLGGDSIKAIRLISKLRSEGYSITVREILQCRTLHTIAEHLKEDNIEEKYEQSEVSGEVIPTPIIKEFARLSLVSPGHFNQSIILELSTEVSEVLINDIINNLWIHHDMLRAIYQDERLILLSSSQLSFPKAVVYMMDNISDKANYINKKCLQLQEGIKLGTGPLLKVALFKDITCNYLVLIAHHLIIDGVSWRIIIEDIQTCISQLNRRERISLPQKTASMIQWGEYLDHISESEYLQSEKPYWDSVIQESTSIKPDSNISHTNFDKYFITTFQISDDLTSQLLSSSNAAYGTEIQELLLSSLSISLNKVFNCTRHTIMLEGHGREPIKNNIDLDRTVGWFTSRYPINIITYPDISKTIMETKDKLRKIPHKGIGYGLLDYQHKFDICFNYLGEIDTSSTYDLNSNVSENNQRFEALTIDCVIRQKTLYCSITYDNNRYGEATISHLKNEFISALSEVVKHCLSRSDRTLTISDFEFDEYLSQDEIDEINGLFNKV